MILVFVDTLLLKIAFFEIKKKNEIKGRKGTRKMEGGKEKEKEERKREGGMKRKRWKEGRGREGGRKEKEREIRERDLLPEN